MFHLSDTVVLKILGILSVKMSVLFSCDSSSFPSRPFFQEAGPEGALGLHRGCPPLA